jgi:outer membrane protein assembly factor BamD
MSILMRTIVRLFLVAAILSNAGCAWFGKGDDETQGWTAQQFYGAAKTALTKGNWEEAIKYYEGLEARYPYGPLSQQGQMEIAYAYYKYGEPENAVAAADRFIQLHPVHPNVDYAYYLKGLASFETKRNIIDRFGGEPDLSDRDPRGVQDAYEAFNELVTRFPDSRYRDDSIQRMVYLLNSMARHDLQVAEYYYGRGAYVAVVNRCKHVVENYQRAPAVEDALALMARAYRKLGMESLAADAVRVLKTNFPKSRYLQHKELSGLSAAS